MMQYVISLIMRLVELTGQGNLECSVCKTVNTVVWYMDVVSVVPSDVSVFALL